MTRPPLVVTVLLALACLAAAHMAAITVYDVILRFGYDQPDPAYPDLVNRDVIWAVMLACGAALAWRDDPAAMAEPGWQPPRWRRIAGGIVAALAALCFAALALVAALRLSTSIATAEISAYGEQPMWPVRLAPVVGFGLAAVVFIGYGVARMRRTPTGARGDVP
jgi:TRAP-type C4-dicarboxylate transport system permease small subunit